MSLHRQRSSPLSLTSIMFPSRVPPTLVHSNLSLPRVVGGHLPILGQHIPILQAIQMTPQSRRRSPKILSWIVPWLGFRLLLPPFGRARPLFAVVKKGQILQSIPTVIAVTGTCQLLFLPPLPTRSLLPTTLRPAGRHLGLHGLQPKVPRALKKEMTPMALGMQKMLRRRRATGISPSGSVGKNV